MRWLMENGRRFNGEASLDSSRARRLDTYRYYFVVFFVGNFEFPFQFWFNEFFNFMNLSISWIFSFKIMNSIPNNLVDYLASQKTVDRFPLAIIFPAIIFFEHNSHSPIYLQFNRRFSHKTLVDCHVSLRPILIFVPKKCM